ncbi:DUF6639 family protein [Sabulicella rubraurantiaca]|uniref:DUF6639 family protein n=1 Tax=Sabulicella rubraurantiaca TaxID=2811429 RepID=UPI001A95FD90|nr:DUF6639 family protein [Sabulicella rubraurantiaca]
MLVPAASRTVSRPCLTALAFLLPFLAGAAMAQPVKQRLADCGTPLLLVRYTHPPDLDHACEAWSRVSAFLLGEHRLRLDAPVELVFSERVELGPETDRLRVLGHFERATRIVQITSIAASWLREPGRLMFRLPMDEELHVSLVAHELAHAILFDNFRVAEPGRACGEYLAYVVQIATMAPHARVQVLAQYPERDFATLDDITEIFHVFFPHEFGVRSYRHFVREGHAYMMELILSGGLQTDLPPM